MLLCGCQGVVMQLLRCSECFSMLLCGFHVVSKQFCCYAVAKLF